MSPAFHKAQARRLIRLNGGLAPSAAVTGLTEACLSGYQNPNVKAFMPAHVIEALEREIGMAVYSAALVNLVNPNPSRSLLEDAMAASRIAGPLPEAVAKALADGEIDEVEERALTAMTDQLEAIAQGIRASLISNKARRAS